ncbi:MAG TPA: phosphomannomutase CpsG [Desulfobaccales bacterium]|nr:phosphomannomutase CpsG [Desulfobaccales bacterium]
MKKLSCFKAYDVRGRVPDELNEDLAYRIGRAYAAFLSPVRVAVGRDIRFSSLPLTEALAAGLNDAGVEVWDLGLCGTEQIYFATSHLKLDGGIMVTASHNPPEYNGMKFVREESRPLSGDSGLKEIERLAAAPDLPPASGSRGGRQAADYLDAYIAHLLSYIDPRVLKPLKVVVNPGNGCAGPVLDALERHLPLRLIKIHHAPDATFPHGVPNPLLPENRHATAQAVRDHEAAVGLAWDGDFDRCFFFDEQGNFIEGYYLVGFIAAALLAAQPGAAIIHDPRLTWNTIDMVREAGGRPVMSKTGHAFIKARMRLENALYGGEMSGHHYFRDFAFCDSGMIPWLLVLERMCRTGQPLSALVRERMDRYPCSGEINRKLLDPDAALQRVEGRYITEAIGIDRTDGLSLEFPAWRLNLRKSNTEPVLRLNVETRQDPALLSAKTAELLGLMT